jgi:beta-glucanase (GH16 family)
MLLGMRSEIVIACSVLLACGALAQTTPLGNSWTLVWSDEFDGPAGTAPNPQYWTYDLGANCCANSANNELKTYTNSAENVHLDGLGDLDIHVENPSPGVYTSARIETEGLLAVTYGRIEARIKIPSGQGMWPAFWMLGSNFTAVGDPNCGEIDIMENIGKTPASAYGSLHGPHDYNVTVPYQLPSGALADDFHVYAVEWSARENAGHRQTTASDLRIGSELWTEAADKERTKTTSMPGRPLA